MRISMLIALALIAAAFAPTTAQEQPPEENAALREKVRELEQRLARVEKQLAAPADDTIRFGDVVVNIKDERHQRYLRIVVAFQVDPANHRELSALVVKKKAELKTWLITYLADQSTKDVSGSAGISRLREDMKRALGKILQQDRKENPIKDVLFEEYVVQ